MDLNQVVQNLNQRRFIAKKFASKEAAGAEALSIIGSRSVGIGGSRTMVDLGMYKTLLSQGNIVFNHTLCAPDQKELNREMALTADVYLCSMNAILFDGRMINIDGTGNRVAATLFGPETVIIIAGKNKLAEDYDSAIALIRRETCPQNARRQGFKTPCALTGICADCRTADRMCNATVIHEYPTRHVKAFYVFLVDQYLGYPPES